ncbi:hypothetical protein [Turicimonas muris]|uniref:hypothetical protein n=1 Tax=Turicimonas muris TaxID=1796652 RepID=UPI001303DAFB|nr:hypothetical protein [Turicimonas muris]QQQ97117.1 hypothetical protein I5Q81_01830 [Turicimonas muris]
MTNNLVCPVIVDAALPPKAIAEPPAIVPIDEEEPNKLTEELPSRLTEVRSAEIETWRKPALAFAISPTFIAELPPVIRRLFPEFITIDEFPFRITVLFTPSEEARPKFTNLSPPTEERMRGFAEVPPTVIAVSFSSKRASSDLTAVNCFLIISEIGLMAGLTYAARERRL